MALTDADLLEQLAIAEARESFWAYRQYINPKLKKGWFQREISIELQRFYDELEAGRKPQLVIEAPPQHGKSTLVIEFVTWLAGKDPDKKTIYASFSDRLGIRANLRCQRIYDNPKYCKIFPETQISGKTALLGSGKALRNQEIIEYIDRAGYFRNTTVNGSITGEELDLGIIDDPVKGRAEARSKTIREKTWEWFTDDFFTRFSEDAGLLAIMTRWDIDDPIGRLKAALGGKVRVLTYRAIATKDEPNRKAGDSLFPEHKSLAFLLERKSTMASAHWEALYQQNPQVVGGEIIKGASFPLYKQPPIIKHRAIYADTAQKTAERNDYSVLQCWGYGEDSKLYLLDQLRGKWEAPELKRRAIAFWQKHNAADRITMGQLRKFAVEDKASGTGLIQELRTGSHIPVAGIPRIRDKYTRLMDVLGYIEAGRVCLPADASYLLDFIAECEAFTADDTHQHDDQVDPMIDAINEMLATTSAAELWSRML